MSQDVEGTQPGRSDAGGPSRDRAVKSVDRAPGILEFLVYEQRAVGASRLALLTPHAIDTFRQLGPELVCVREPGYALDLEESAVSLGCVGVGVVDYRGATLAAAAVSVASARFGEERRPALVDLVREDAEQIPARLADEPRNASLSVGLPAGGGAIGT